MDTKTEIIGAVVLGVIIVGLTLWYMSEHPAPYVNQPETPSTTQQMPNGGNGSPLTLNESGKYYTVKASYPSSTTLKQSASAQADAQAVEIMKQFEINTIGAFKEQGNFDNLSATDIQMLGLDQGRMESLGITYTSKTGPHTISYLYSIEEDTLGAHPNAYFRSFTFNTKTGSGLDIGDLFAPGTDYLSLLSTISRKMLPSVITHSSEGGASQVNTGMINAGTTPDADNFQNWYVDGSSLVLVFPPYQVAPYAAGEQIVTIPFSQISSELSATYK